MHIITFLLLLAQIMACLTSSAQGIGDNGDGSEATTYIYPYYGLVANGNITANAPQVVNTDAMAGGTIDPLVYYDNSNLAVTSSSSDILTDLNNFLSGGLSGYDPYSGTGTSQKLGELKFIGPGIINTNCTFIPDNPNGLYAPGQQIPGHYDCTANLEGTLFLNGDSSDIFIIKVYGDLTITGLADLEMGRTNPANVYWDVTGNVTIADGAIFSGIVHATGDINIIKNYSGKLALFAERNINLGGSSNYYWQPNLMYWTNQDNNTMFNNCNNLFVNGDFENTDMTDICGTVNANSDASIFCSPSAFQTPGNFSKGVYSVNNKGINSNYLFGVNGTNALIVNPPIPASSKWVSIWSQRVDNLVPNEYYDFGATAYVKDDLSGNSANFRMVITSYNSLNVPVGNTEYGSATNNGWGLGEIELPGTNYLGEKTTGGILDWVWTTSSGIDHAVFEIQVFCIQVPELNLPEMALDNIYLRPHNYAQLAKITVPYAVCGGQNCTIQFNEASYLPGVNYQLYFGFDITNGQFTGPIQGATGNTSATFNASQLPSGSNTLYVGVVGNYQHPGLCGQGNVTNPPVQVALNITPIIYAPNPCTYKICEGNLVTLASNADGVYGSWGDNWHFQYGTITTGAYIDNSDPLYPIFRSNTPGFYILEANIPLSCSIAVCTVQVKACPQPSNLKDLIYNWGNGSTSPLKVSISTNTDTPDPNLSPYRYNPADPDKIYLVADDYYVSGDLHLTAAAPNIIYLNGSGPTYQPTQFVINNALGNNGTLYGTRLFMKSEIPANGYFVRHPGISNIIVEQDVNLIVKSNCSFLPSSDGFWGGIYGSPAIRGIQNIGKINLNGGPSPDEINVQGSIHGIGLPYYSPTDPGDPSPFNFGNVGNVNATNVTFKNNIRCIYSGINFGIIPWINTTASASVTSIANCTFYVGVETQTVDNSCTQSQYPTEYCIKVAKNSNVVITGNKTLLNTNLSRFGFSSVLANDGGAIVTMSKNDWQGTDRGVVVWGGGNLTIGDGNAGSGDNFNNAYTPIDLRNSKAIIQNSVIVNTYTTNSDVAPSLYYLEDYYSNHNCGLTVSGCTFTSETGIELKIYGRGSGQVDITSNQFNFTKAGILFGDATINGLTNGTNYPSLTLHCNEFKVSPSSYSGKIAGLLIGGDVGNLTTIGGNGTGQSDKPSGNVWPVQNRATATIAGWTSPANWYSVYNKSVNAIDFYRYSNEYQSYVYPASGATNVVNIITQQLKATTSNANFTSPTICPLNTCELICEAQFPGNYFPPTRLAAPSDSGNGLTEILAASDGKEVLGNPVPNPANDETSISYTIRGNAQKAKLVVYEAATGREISEYELDFTRNNQILSTKTFNPGFYTIMLEVDGSALAIRKLVIIK